jgi:hypothetical protein
MKRSFAYWMLIFGFYVISFLLLSGIAKLIYPDYLSWGSIVTFSIGFAIGYVIVELWQRRKDCIKTHKVA